ncbi:MAG: hypothetical protein ACJAV5_000184 [Vicingaceae bacterium]|jgi:hypothetical protein
MTVKRKFVIVKLVFLLILGFNILPEYNQMHVYPSISFPKFKYKSHFATPKLTDVSSDSIQKRSNTILRLIKPFDKRFYLFYQQKIQSTKSESEEVFEIRLQNLQQFYDLE